MGLLTAPKVLRKASILYERGHESRFYFKPLKQLRLSGKQTLQGSSRCSAAIISPVVIRDTIRRNRALAVGDVGLSRSQTA
jgi:hypothetical protein